MAEIFSTAAAAAALLEQAIQLFERIRSAHDRQKGLPALIEKYLAEITQTKGIVELVRNENALKTPSVGGAINTVDSVGKALLEHLFKINSSKSPVQEFFHQLVSGKKEEDKIESIIKDLSSAKTNVVIHVQIANVGLVQGVGQAVQLNIAAVKEMNKLLEERLGSGHVLKISQLLDEKSPNENGTLTLSKEDIAFLADSTAVNVPGFSGIVTDNEASDQALLLNTPIGDNIWRGMKVVVKGNKGSGRATMVNAPMGNAAFRDLLQARK